VIKAFSHYASRTRLWGQRAPGIPHALQGAKDFGTTRALRAAGTRNYISPSLARNDDLKTSGALAV
jgi:hypothetical protein